MRMPKPEVMRAPSTGVRSSDLRMASPLGVKYSPSPSRSK